MRDRQIILADRIYCDVFQRIERETMEKLRTGMLPTDDDIYVEIGDRAHRFTFNGSFSRHGNAPHYRLRLILGSGEAVYRRFPYDKHNQCVEAYNVRTSIGSDAQEFLHAADALNSAITDAHQQLSATLDTFFTVEKLLAAWPEIAPFVPSETAPKPQLPALPTAQLNALFKLPVSV